MLSVDNTRVAKNAIALTLRMVLVTIVGLYTSRIVLKVLGVEDYGIYGVIGGVVAMSSFLNTSMAAATGRFITFELGRGVAIKLRRIFSTALFIHIIIAFVVAILAETFGLWFVNNKMNFPPGSMFAVNVLYQFTIISMMVGFTQVPYTAIIIAHEKMSVYAYFEIINVVLKLVIVYILMLVEDNRLIFYAAMILAVTIMSALLYRCYCVYKYEEARVVFVWDKKIIKAMLTFSGFDLYGNMCTTIKFQSIPIILNLFFGVVANVGASIANTVTGAISGMTNSIAQAFNPQIIKQYSIGNLNEMSAVMRRSVQFTLLAYAMIALPVFVNTHTILFAWLGQVPNYSIEFIRLIIMTAFFSIIVTSSNAAVHATGNIKKISFYSGTLHLFTPIVSYLLLHYVIRSASIVYAVNIALMFVIVVVGFRFVYIQVHDFNIKQYIRAIVMSMVSIAITYLTMAVVHKSIASYAISDKLVIQLLIVIVEWLVGAIILFILSMSLALDRPERNYLISFIKNKVRYIRV